MQAVVMHEFGGPEVLQLQEWPTPRPGPGEVLVRVRASALNRRDLATRRGLRGRELPRILGIDVAGEVAELGPGVPARPPGARPFLPWPTATSGLGPEAAPTAALEGGVALSVDSAATGQATARPSPGLAAGDAVVLLPYRYCGLCDQCRSGWPNSCRALRLLGAGADGGFAEYIVVPAANVYPKPPALSFAEAAALPVVYLTVWHMLARAGLRAGESVLVVGASSGIGTAAIQAARLLGARVLAAARGTAKCERARALGAELVVDLEREDLAAEILRWSGGIGVDVVVEPVGAATFPASMRCLAQRGRLVVCGATAGSEVTLDLLPFFLRNQQVQGASIGTPAEFWEVLRHAARGVLRPVVDSVLPLSQAAEAHRRLEAGERFGKLVVAPDPDAAR